MIKGPSEHLLWFLLSTQTESHFIRGSTFRSGRKSCDDVASRPLRKGPCPDCRRAGTPSAEQNLASTAGATCSSRWPWKSERWRGCRPEPAEPLMRQEADLFKESGPQIKTFWTRKGARRPCGQLSWQSWSSFSLSAGPVLSLLDLRPQTSFLKFLNFIFLGGGSIYYTRTHIYAYLACISLIDRRLSFPLSGSVSECFKVGGVNYSQ